MSIPEDHEKFASLASGTPPPVSQRILIAIIVVSSLSIFTADTLLPLGFTVPILYLIPLLLTSKSSYPASPFVVAASSTVLSFTSIWLSTSGYFDAALFNCTLVSAACWINAGMIWRSLQTDALLRQRTDALVHAVKVLRSFFDANAIMMGIVELDNGEIIHRADNYSAALFLGTTPEAMRDRTATELGVPPNVVRAWVRQCQESVSKGKPIRAEYVRPYANDLQQPYHAISLTISFIGVSIEGKALFSFIKEDITDWKHGRPLLEAYPKLQQA